MKIEADELTKVILGGRDLAAELEQAGRPMSGAIINVLCDIAIEKEEREAEEVAQAQAVAHVAAAVQEIPEKSHRHVWGGLNGGVCVAEPGCMAKPRKKKEAAPAAEGGGSLL